MTGGDEFSFLPGKGTVIYQKIHRNSRLRNLLERNWIWIFRRTKGVSDVDICNTGNGYNRADTCLFNLYFIKSIKFIKFADLYFFHLVRVVVVAEHDLLINADSPVFHFSDADTAHILVVVNGTDQNLCGSFRISCWSRDILQYGFKKGLHAFWCISQVKDSVAGLC